MFAIAATFALPACEPSSTTSGFDHPDGSTGGAEQALFPQEVFPTADTVIFDENPSWQGNENRAYGSEQELTFGYRAAQQCYGGGYSYYAPLFKFSRAELTSALTAGDLVQAKLRVTPVSEGAYGYENYLWAYTLNPARNWATGAFVVDNVSTENTATGSCAHDTDLANIIPECGLPWNLLQSSSPAWGDLDWTSTYTCDGRSSCPPNLHYGAGQAIDLDLTQTIQAFLANPAAGPDLTVLLYGGYSVGPCQYCPDFYGQCPQYELPRLASREHTNMAWRPRMILSLSTGASPPDMPSPPPQLNGATTQTTLDEYSFLTEGTTPVQYNFGAGSVDRRRAALVRGQVFTTQRFRTSCTADSQCSGAQRCTGSTPGSVCAAQTPLSGVRISVLGRPQLGVTRTRNGAIYDGTSNNGAPSDNGWFDLLVEGGGPLTIVYEKPGYVTVQRTIDTVPFETAVLPDVAMTPYSAGQSVTLPTSQWVASHTLSDLGGSGADCDSSLDCVGGQICIADVCRAPGVVIGFPANTAVTRTPVGGAPSALTGPATLYSTVLTNNPRLPADAMPAILPPRSAFTFAADFHFEGTSPTDSITFSNSVGNVVYAYVPVPFSSLPLSNTPTTGRTVPNGYYNRTTGTWMPENDGWVLNRAGSTITGNPGAFATGELAFIQALSQEQLPNGKFVRVPLSHFSVSDFNWAMEAIGDLLNRAVDAALKDPDDPCDESGSIVGCDDQTLGEQVEIVGTPFSASYTSDRVPGRSSAYSMRIRVLPPYYNPTTYAGLKAITVEVSVAGTRTRQRFVRDAVDQKPGDLLFDMASTPPGLGRVWVYTWSGYDQVGRRVQGRQLATVRLIDEYEGVYAPVPIQGRTFGAAADGALPPYVDNTTQRIRFERIRREWLGTWDETQTGLGGWRIDAHHAWDPTSRTVFFGNGSRRSAFSIGTVIRLQTDTLNVANFAPASMAWSNRGTFYVLSKTGRGRVYEVTDPGSADVAASVVCFIGCAASGVMAPVDNLDANAANFTAPSDIAVASDGTIYLTNANIVWQIRRGTDSVWRLRRFAGNATSGPDGDGMLARDALLSGPRGLAVGNDGTVFIADWGNARVRAVMPTSDGSGEFIRTVAGNSGGTPPDCATAPCQALGTTLAANTKIGAPNDLIATPSGDLFILEQSNRVMLLNQDGQLRRVRQWPAAGTTAFNDSQFSLAPDGTLYVGTGTGTGTTSHTIRRLVPPTGESSSAEWSSVAVAGNGLQGTIGDGGDPLLARLDRPTPFVAPNGVLWIGSSALNGLRRIESAFPGVGLSDTVIPSADGSVLYRFDYRGLHTATQDRDTLATLLTFNYANYGANTFLTSISNPDATLLTINRDGSGLPMSFVGRWGRTSTLAFTGTTTPCIATSAACKMLSRITLTSDNGYHEFGYANGGLLSDFWMPERRTTHHFDYVTSADTLLDLGGINRGRLRRDTDGNLGPDPARVLTLSRSLANSGNDITSVLTYPSGAGRTIVNSLADQRNSGASRTVYESNGAQTQSVFVIPTAVDQPPYTQVTSPSGIVTQIVEAADQALGMQAPYASRVVTRIPRGGATIPPAMTPFEMVVATTQTGTAIGGNRTITVNINNAPTSATVTYNSATRTYTMTSAQGRVSTMTVDSRGRFASMTLPGATQTITNNYVPTGSFAGLMQDTGQGSRRITAQYDAAGTLYATSSPTSWTRFTHDARERVSKLSLWRDETDVDAIFSHDKDGFMLSASTWNTYNGYTPQGTYTWAPTAAGREDTFTPPSAPAAYDRDYDADGRLIRVALPSGRAIETSYRADGRLNAIQFRGAGGTPVETYQPTYDTDPPYNGSRGWQLNALSSPFGPTLSFGYDADLNTQQSWGAGYGTVAVQPNNRMLTNEVWVNGTPVISNLAYDLDGLLTSGSSATFGVTQAFATPREAATGKISYVDVGGTRADPAYDPVYGNLSALANTYLGENRYSVSSIVRDNGGRLSSLTQQYMTLEGTRAEVYGYDYASRLTSVTRNGFAHEGYWYDDNGNRGSARWTGQSEFYATYGTGDRLISLSGGAVRTYTHDDEGNRQTATVGGVTTTYTHNQAGQLIQATKGAQTVTYSIDALGRRVGRTVDGIVQARWLYRDALRPVAELDGAGTLQTLFVHASGGMTPDFMIQASGVYRIFTDERGSPRLVVCVSGGCTPGNVIERHDYTAYGVRPTPVVVTGPSGYRPIPFGFAGGLYDPITELTHFGAREYDAFTGRWIERDPIRFDGGDLNLYAYCGGDPVNYVDLNGRNPFLIAIGAAAAGGAIIGGGGELVGQLISNGGNLSAVQVDKVLLAGSIGGLVGGGSVALGVGWAGAAALSMAGAFLNYFLAGALDNVLRGGANLSLRGLCIEVASAGAGSLIGSAGGSLLKGPVGTAVGRAAGQRPPVSAQGVLQTSTPDWVDPAVEAISGTMGGQIGEGGGRTVNLTMQHLWSE